MEEKEAVLVLNLLPNHHGSSAHYREQEAEWNPSCVNPTADLTWAARTRDQDALNTTKICRVHA